MPRAADASTGSIRQLASAPPTQLPCQLGSVLADDSESDLDEGEGAQGAWLANWVQDEFGADLQVRFNCCYCLLPGMVCASADRADGTKR